MTLNDFLELKDKITSELSDSELETLYFALQTELRQRDILKLEKQAFPDEFQDTGL